MENQPPSFPFDAFDGAMDDMGFDPANLFPPPAPPVGTRGDALDLVRQKLRELDGQIRTILELLDREVAGVRSPTFAPLQATVGAPQAARAPMEPKHRPIDPLPSSIARADAEATHIIEGVFDGQHMVGPDGKQYSVPSNYASKSKLVEGDILKLRITGRGAFVYKQIGPIARDRKVGILERDDVSGEFVAIVPDAEADRTDVQRAIVERSDLPMVEYKRFRILRASVTYYHGEPGDEAVVLVPKDAPSTWAAVENIIKR